MRASPIPKYMLPHTIEYHAHAGVDDFGSESYGDPLVIEHVRFDESTVFSRDGTQNKVVANGVVFVDTVNSSPLPNEFIEQSKIIFRGRELIIQKVIPCYQVASDEVRHYELEVL